MKKIRAIIASVFIFANILGTFAFSSGKYYLYISGWFAVFADYGIEQLLLAEKLIKGNMDFSVFGIEKPQTIGIILLLALLTLIVILIVCLTRKYVDKYSKICALTGVSACITGILPATALCINIFNAALYPIVALFAMIAAMVITLVECRSRKSDLQQLYNFQ